MRTSVSSIVVSYSKPIRVAISSYERSDSSTMIVVQGEGKSLVECGECGLESERAE
jgi:uncharacterized ferredoxin-like protein